VFEAFARRITAPVLLVDAGASGYAPPDAAAREEYFADRRKVVVEGAGHMIQWTQPAALGEALVAFLREVGA
jgi:pimeloyl-ACP methyl ester carboxylesterase